MTEARGLAFEETEELRQEEVEKKIQRGSAMKWKTFH